MTLFEKTQAVVDSAPTPVSLTVMLGGLVLSILQPIAVLVTIVWGCLQIHGYVEKRWGWSWVTRLFRKGK